jgi:hypothetical protein
MNGVMFGGEGPVMQGTWYNPKTHDIFTVRDSFFEDNNYVVTTTDGRCLSYNQIQNYIQTDTPIEQLKESFKKEQENKVEEIPAEIKSMLADVNEDPYSDYMIPGDNIYGEALGNINQKHLAPASQHTYSIKEDKPVSINRTIIEKGLKNANGPKVTINIDWNDYPESEIAMLTNMMDIPHEEIAEWFCDNMDVSWVYEDIKNAIYNKLLPNKVKEDKKKEKADKPTAKTSNKVKEDKPTVKTYKKPKTIKK